MVYCAGKLIENLKLSRIWSYSDVNLRLVRNKLLFNYYSIIKIIKAIDHTFYGFTSMITHLECWENTRKACKSRAEGEWFTSFSSVPPSSQVGYHAGKPIESVVYCFNIFVTCYIRLFQLRLLLRRMMHDPCFIARRHYCSKSSKLCARNEPWNLESKRCWRFYAMSAER